MCIFHNVDLQRCLSVRGGTVVLRAQRPLSLASTALDCLVWLKHPTPLSHLDRLC